MFFNPQMLDFAKLVMILDGYSERQKIALENQERVHQDFLNRLRQSALRFKKELTKEIELRLTKNAYHGKRVVRFEWKPFSSKSGNVKISTMVYGWRTSNNEWDHQAFLEIGYDPTPFEVLVKEFKEKGINVRNISDPKKGFGFWIEASF